jgi:iron(III) transport system substrate-binding protein
VLIALLLSCRVEVGRPAQVQAEEPTGPVQLWVYTSLYQEVIDQLQPAAKQALPDVELLFFQGGSEKVAQRWEAEHEAGGSRACLIATSDPGWYVDLSRRGLLRTYITPRALDLPRPWVRPTWATVRLGMMVMASTVEPAPSAFRELVDPAWRDRYSSGDPLSSGTTFTTVSAWERIYGEEHSARLQQNGWVKAGGNSAVLGRMESGERPIGVLLLENLLLKPGRARVIWPEDGAVPIPGPLAIPSDCPSPAAAERVYDWLFSDAAQQLIVQGAMYSPFPELPPPKGAPALSELHQMELPADFLDWMASGSEARKQRLQAN